MKKILLLVLLVSLNSSFAFANNQPCSDKIGREIDNCLVQEESKADKELNLLYKQLIKADSRHKKELIQSELAWIKFRDLECKFQSLSYEGGTELSREYSRTFIKLTKERIEHLKNAIRKIE